jgi:hypothetical protein
MKSSKMIMMNKKGDLLVFWWTRKKLYIESKFGTIFTEQVDEVLHQVAYDLSQDELTYIGDV